MNKRDNTSDILFFEISSKGSNLIFKNHPVFRTDLTFHKRCTDVFSLVQKVWYVSRL